MKYSVEIQTGDGYQNVTKYLIEEPTIRQNVEGEFTWLFWFDEIRVTFIYNLMKDHNIETKQRVRIQYPEDKEIVGFIEDINVNPYNEEEVDLNIMGYDKLLSREEISIGGYQETISETVAEIRDEGNRKLRDRGYNISNLGQNIDSDDSIVFDAYKGIELDPVYYKYEEIGLNYPSPTYTDEDIYWEHQDKGFFVEIVDDNFQPFTAEYPESLVGDPFFRAKNQKVLYGSIGGYVIDTMSEGTGDPDYAMLWDVDLYYYDGDDVKRYWNKEYKETNIEGEYDPHKVKTYFYSIESNDFYVIKIGNRYFRYIAQKRGELYYNYTDMDEIPNGKKWKQYMEKLMVNSPKKVFGVWGLTDSIIYEAQIQSLVPFQDFLYCIVHIKYKNVVGFNDDGSPKFEKKDTTTMFYGEIYEEDLLSYVYEDIKIGEILKDILITTDNLLYISGDTISINDRVKARGTQNIKQKDIVEYREQTKDLEFEQPMEVSVSNTIIESEDDQGGVFIMQGSPFDIKGDIINYYKTLTDTKEEEIIDMVIMNEGQYSDIIGKKTSYGTVTSAHPKEETMEIKIKNRK